MHRLLKGFAGRADDRLTILAHWSRDWDGDPTDTRSGGTLCPLMRSVDLGELSAGALAEAHRIMPAAAFGALDASAMYTLMSAEKSKASVSLSALAGKRILLPSCSCYGTTEANLNFFSCGSCKKSGKYGKVSDLP